MKHDGILVIAEEAQMKILQEAGGAIGNNRVTFQQLAKRRSSVLETRRNSILENRKSFAGNSQLGQRPSSMAYQRPRSGQVEFSNKVSNELIYQYQ